MWPLDWWFEYQTCTHRGVICYIWELAHLGRDRLSRIKAANARVLRIQKIKSIQRYIQMINYYSALKRKKILAWATKWINLGDIMLGKIKDKEEKILHDSIYMKS